MSGPGRAELEPGYILHTRVYRETSLILEMFTPGFGRTGLIAKGARRPKSSFRGILNPFMALNVSWTGRGELPTLTHAEPIGAHQPLNGSALMAGFYVNELLLKLLHRHDPHPNLFVHYGSLLAKLGDGPGVPNEQVERVLRIFELELLQEIGYALNLEEDAIAHLPLDDEKLYEFRAEEGPVEALSVHAEVPLYTGAELVGIARKDFDDPHILRKAKALLRSVLDYYIGDRGLHTRRIAAAMKR